MNKHISHPPLTPRQEYLIDQIKKEAKLVVQAFLFRQPIIGEQWRMLDDPEIWGTIVSTDGGKVVMSIRMPPSTENVFIDIKKVIDQNG